MALLTRPSLTDSEAQQAKVKLWDNVRSGMYRLSLVVGIDHRCSEQLVAAFASRFAQLAVCTSASVSDMVKRLCEQENTVVPAVFHPLRFLLSGRVEGPGIPDLIEFLGPAETLRRLHDGLAVVHQQQH